MYIPNDIELAKLTTATENVETVLHNMLNSKDYSVEEDCELATKLLLANDKIITALTYFNIRKRTV